MPDVAHSVREEYRGANTERIDYYPFLGGIKSPISLEYNLRSAQLTLDVDGKPEKDWNVPNLVKAFPVWFNFTHKGHKFSLRKR